MIGLAPAPFVDCVDILTEFYDKKIVSWAVKKLAHGFETIGWKVIDKSPKS